MDVSNQIHRIYTEASDLARSSGKMLGSAHFLLAMFTEESSPNQARTVLQELELNEDRIIEAIRNLGPEPEDTMRVMHEKTQMTALSCDAELINSLHLLLAITGCSRSLAYRALERLGVNIGQLRVQVFSYVNGVLPRRFYNQAQGSPCLTAPLVAQCWEEENAVSREEREEERAWAEAALRKIRAKPPRVRSAFSGPEREAATAQALKALVADARREPAVDRDADGAASRFALDPKKFPVLCALGRNLSVDAERGRLDPVIERDDELEQILDILHKRKANNPCIIGEPGVGKTAIAEGVAQRLVADGEGAELRSVIEVNVPSLVAGTQLRGAFSERMADLRREVAQAGRRVILFIDELHMLLGAGAGAGPMDAANDLKAALSRGDFPCIGATTTKEYRLHIEADPALERRFQPIVIEEPSEAAAHRILDGLLPRYAGHHGVTYGPDCVDTAVRLSARYVPDRRLPDKALNLIDLAGARVARSGGTDVTTEDVARVVAKLAAVPLERLVQSDAQRLLEMDHFLSERIIGQPKPLDRITAVIQRNSAGFRSHRPIGSFLLLGPTGVGKTETVRVLADFLFQDRSAVTTFDMSEFLEAHSVSKLIGAAPGYVGHEDGGQLTEAVRRRPYQILLFDEVEKASREVLQILLQLLEEGTVTDGRGRRVEFRNTVVAMTSNLGWKVFEEKRGGFGFATGDDGPAASGPSKKERVRLERAVLAAARKSFAPELWNRMEEKLVYHPLQREHVARVAELLLVESADRLAAETGIRYEAAPAVVDHLIAHGGFDARYGARPMRRTIQRLVEGAVSQVILTGAAQRGDAVSVVVDDGRLTALKNLPAAAAAAS